MLLFYTTHPIGIIIFYKTNFLKKIFLQFRFLEMKTFLTISLSLSLPLGLQNSDLFAMLERIKVTRDCSKSPEEESEHVIFSLLTPDFVAGALLLTLFLLQTHSVPPLTPFPISKCITFQSAHCALSLLMLLPVLYTYILRKEDEIVTLYLMAQFC